MNNKLYILIGCPGSGKSTFCKKFMKEDDVYVSRDLIRFSMIKDCGDYFSKEKDVFKEYCKQISNALKNGKTVFADATHVNEKSRTKLLSNLDIHPDELNAIYFNVPLEICAERNNKRKGIEKVPDDVLENMYYSMTYPVVEDGFSNLYIIDEEENVTIIKLKGDE